MKKLTIASVLITLGLCLLIGLKWHHVHSTFKPNENELLTEADVDAYLKSHKPEVNNITIGELDRIPTGIYVDSMKFESANDIYVSGYVWQELIPELLKSHEPGIIFPNAVGGITFDEAYKHEYDGKTVFGWYFEACLRQTFDYSNYPIDHKMVWIKMLPKDFNSNAVLIPSLKSYDSTGKEASFGLAEDIVLTGWDVNETFFNFMPTKFDTDFGLHDHHPRKHVPELAFNIILNRELASAFMINITLLIVSMTLLFSLIAMLTTDSDLKEAFNMTVGGAVGTCAGIFFAILIAHIHLRGLFPGSGLVYIEYFYLTSYFFILLTAVFIYLFFHNKISKEKGLFVKDAAIIKALFWPIYLGIITLCTWLHFGLKKRGQVYV